MTLSAQATVHENRSRCRATRKVVMSATVISTSTRRSRVTRATVSTNASEAPTGSGYCTRSLQ
jgi:hypothetical protein